DGVSRAGSSSIFEGLGRATAGRAGVLFTASLGTDLRIGAGAGAGVGAAAAATGAAGGRTIVGSTRFGSGINSCGACERRENRPMRFVGLGLSMTIVGLGRS